MKTLTLALTLTLAVGLAGCDGGTIMVQATTSLDPCAAPSGQQIAESAPLYDESRVIELRLTISDADWTKLMGIHDNPPADWGSNKVYVHCGLDFDGKHFDAACRPRGSTANWKLERKPQLVIKFDEWDSKGRFLGLRRTNLDDTLYPVAPVRQRLGLGLMRAAGIESARANHARVYRNGDYLGLYTNIEEIDAEFAQHRFPGSTGNLYSSGLTVLENNKKTADTSRRDRLASLMANAATGDAYWPGKLSALLDIQQALRLSAAESLLPAGDGWINGSLNWFGYDDPCSGHFTLIPTDFERSIGMFGPPDADAHGGFIGLPELLLPGNALLVRLLAEPSARASYDTTLVELRDGPFAKWAAQVDTVCGQIRADFVMDARRVATPEQFDADCADLKKRAADRVTYLRGQLGK